jgi:hypothetical protein
MTLHTPTESDYEDGPAAKSLPLWLSTSGYSFAALWVIWKKCLATEAGALLCARMKKLTLLALVAVIGSFVLVGCEKKQEVPAVPEVPKEAPKAP